MKKLLLSWVLPFFIAIVLVVILRGFFVDIVSISETNTYFIKSKSKSRNQLVLYKTNNNSDSCIVIRKIALPGDTLRIRRGEVYVNGKRVAENEVISSYSFKTDSINNVSEYLNRNLIKYNIATAYIGSFIINALKIQVDSIAKEHQIYDIKEIYLNKELSAKRILGNELYWNKDNIGPLIVPEKGMKMRISKRFYVIYKEVIQNETGKSLVLKNGKIYLNNKPLEIYTFKNDYCFLLNDDKSDLNDSRTFGFVKEKDVKGKYWVSL